MTSWFAEQVGGNITPDAMKSQITNYVTKKLENPGEARQWGSELVEGPKGGKSQGGLAGAIGKAVAAEMPNAPNLNTLPKIFMGFQQGGFGGGMSQLGSALSSGLGGLFKTSEVSDPSADLPDEVTSQIGDAFQGSNAATNAANILAPSVNKTFDHLIENSIFGSGLKMLADPSAYLSDKAKEFGLGKPFSGGGKTQDLPPGTSGGAQ